MRPSGGVDGDDASRQTRALPQERVPATARQLSGNQHTTKEGPVRGEGEDVDRSLSAGRPCGAGSAGSLL